MERPPVRISERPGRILALSLTLGRIWDEVRVEDDAVHIAAFDECEQLGIPGQYGIAGHVLEGYFSPLLSRVYLGVERIPARWTDTLVAISLRLQRELEQRYRFECAGRYLSGTCSMR